MEKNKVKFEEYGIEFEDSEFENMTKKELQECDELLKKIEEIVDKK